MHFEKKLNSNNFSIYVTKMYTPPDGRYNVKELNKDLKLFQYIGKNLKRYYNKKNINMTIIKNQVITLNNLLGSLPTNRCLFFYCDESLHDYIKTLLFHLDILHSDIPEVNIQKLKIDEELLEQLRK